MVLKVMLYRVFCGKSNTDVSSAKYVVELELTIRMELCLVFGSRHFDADPLSRMRVDENKTGGNQRGG